MARMFETVEKELAAASKKARDKGCWFYCVQNKQWMTPEDYEKQGLADLIVYGANCRNVILNFHMSDPREGIRTRMAVAIKATAEAQEFTERVFEYFNNVPKDIR